MKIIILSDHDHIGGINTWNSVFCTYLSKLSIEYEYISSDKFSENDLLNRLGNIFIVNGLTNYVFYKNINELGKKNKIYYVLHNLESSNNLNFLNHINCYRGVIIIWKEMKDYLEFLREDQIIYIPNYVNIKKYPQKSLNMNTVRLCFVGRFSVEKNIPMILYCLDNIKNNIKFKFNIYGDSNDIKYRKYLLNLINSLSENIQIKLNPFDESIEKIYNSNDVIILASVTEGVPYCIIEAASYGLKILSSNVGGVSSIVKDGLFQFKKINKEPNKKQKYLLPIISYEEKLKSIGYIELHSSKKKLITDGYIHSCVDSYTNKYDIIDRNFVNNFRVIPSIHFNKEMLSDDCIGCDIIRTKQDIWNKNIEIMSSRLLDIIKNDSQKITLCDEEDYIEGIKSIK